MLFRKVENELDDGNYDKAIGSNPANPKSRTAATNALSNSAIAPMIWNINRPEAADGPNSRRKQCPRLYHRQASRGQSPGAAVLFGAAVSGCGIAIW
jgi:hypothetical protein